MTSAERVPLAPDVPTVAEAGGLPGYESASWLGLLAPARTPPSIVNKLNAEIERMMQSRDVREQLAVRAWVPLIHSPTALANKLKSNVVRWGKVIRAAGVKVD